MQKQDFVASAEKNLTEIIELLKKKGKEYSNGDTFSNFKAASGGLSFHKKPEMVAWEYMVKHLQSVKDIISGDVPSSKEILDEKFNDIIVYSLLIKGMLQEKLDADAEVRLKYTLTQY